MRDAADPTVRDLRRFVTAAFGELRAVVDCDFVSMLYRNVGNGMLREIDSRGRTYSPAFMRRYAELTPAIPLVLQNRGVKVLPTRTHMTIPEEALTASPFYREIMRPQGWRHAVALCFWGEPSSEFPVLVVTVNRGEQRPDFSEQEIRRLARIHAVLDGWVTDIFEHAAAEQAYRSVTTIVDRDAKGILVLDWKFRSTFANSAAAKLCAVWDGSVPRPDPTGTRRVRVPPMLLTACRDLYSEWRGTLRGSGGTSRSGRAVNVVHPVMRMLSARVSIRYPDANGLAEPSFVIELHRRHPAPAAVRRVPLDSLVTLTRAEQEVARALGDGLSNQEIAERLGKTVYAVKFLLHRTYRRLGIANRTQLASVIRRAEVKRSG